MVNSDSTILAPSPLRWCSISTEEVRNNAYRLDASAYDIEAMEALSRVYHSPYGWVYLWGENGLVKDAYHGPRAKRNYLPTGIPFIGSSEMLEVKPNPTKFVDKSFLDNYGVKRGQVLLSCSGTIGRTSFVNRTLEGYCVSQHALKITANYAGYVYAYLSTKVGRSIVKSFTYGAVIDEIEPEHLKNLPIPNAPEEIKRSIHDAVIASYDLRDQSNDLIDEAQRLLYEALGLPEKMDLKPKYYVPQAGFRCFTMSSNELNNRFDVSYHLPEIKEILSLISKQAEEVTTLGDPRISKEIILAGVFKRTYVNEGSGIPFLGGRDITQLAPKVEKYLSYSVHKVRIHKELEVFENYILISDRGTIGKVQIVPKHWKGWAVSQNIIKLIPTSSSIAGYIYIYLQTSLGQALIKRETYGSVVDMIDDNNVASIPIPLLKDNSMQSRINDLVLRANELRYQAYLKEQDALQQMEKVLKR
ncbi:restriction endonuclease subunit S [Prevotella melaninogenica]